MDYRIEKKGKQRFIARVRSFSNELMNDESDKSIPIFWTECYEKKIVEQIRNLRPEGKKDLFGLCSPTQKDSLTFDYGIGVEIDDETDTTYLSTLTQEGFSLWETEPTDYVVLECCGKDGECISEMWSRFYKEFLPHTNYEQLDSTDYEIYYQTSKEGLFCELWIPVVVK